VLRLEVVTPAVLFLIGFAAPRLGWPDSDSAAIIIAVAAVWTAAAVSWAAIGWTVRRRLPKPVATRPALLPLGIAPPPIAIGAVGGGVGVNIGGSVTIHNHQPLDVTADAHNTGFAKAEQLMPELLAEMRRDLASHPLCREFVVMKKNNGYWAKGNELFYFYDDHPELDNKLRILESLELVRDITYNNATRFLMTERLAEYLRA